MKRLIFLILITPRAALAQSLPQTPFGPNSAKTFVEQLFTTWSGSRSNSALLLNEKYSDTVDFYGVPTSKQDVLKKDRQFIRKWQVRTYDITSMEPVICDQVTATCTISGQDHWDDFAPALRQRSVGDASFSYSIQYLDGQYKISKEDGQVLDRNIVAATAPALSPLSTVTAAEPVSYQRANSSSKHGCIIFGGTAPKPCESWPSWTTGQWTIAPGIKTVRVLIVGGGGGGSASIERGIGGTGGASGEVVTSTVNISTQQIVVQVGEAGNAGLEFGQPGRDGAPSSFGALVATGGGAGEPHCGGETRVTVGGSSAGGGAGGGSYDGNGYHGGNGGSGGTGGSSGRDGQPGDDGDAVLGTPGGIGTAFSALGFKDVTVTNGPGGAGGSYGSDRIGYGGGGGGGGGGIIIGQTAPRGNKGESDESQSSAEGGDGGVGFGAGGGGGGNFKVGAVGGQGAPGVVYVEW